MNAGTRSSRHRSDVNDEVSDLAIEIVLIGIPVDTVRVWVGIDDGDTRELGRCFDRWDGNRIANKLRVIVLDDRRTDQIRSRWKVNNSRGYSTRIASLTAAAAIRNGVVYCRGIVCGAISSCAIVLNITEYLVRRVPECNGTLPLDVSNPVRRRGRGGAVVGGSVAAGGGDRRGFNR